MDCSPGIENHAMFLVQSPEDLMIREIDEAAEELLLERLAEAISQLSPTQARRLYARYTLKKKYREIAADEGVSGSCATVLPGLCHKACQAESHSQGHGRYESRTCYVCEDIGWLEGREKWSGLAGIGVIFCKVEQAGKISKQAHYFLYSRSGMTASQILEAKRSHWSIENQLHWVLDMQFREDESRARADNSAENLNVLRHWAYNILKAEKLYSQVGKTVIR